MTKQQHLLRLPLVIIVLFTLFACSQEGVTDPVKPPAVVDTSAAQTASSAVIDMGTGFNLGNTFDLSQHSTAIGDIRPVIDLYIAAGMRHIRIPVTWKEGFGGNTLANAGGTVNYLHPRFLQLKAVIDYALGKGLYVVVNAHHEHWLKDNYDASPAHDSVFTTMWRGIASYYKDYSYHLIFEVLNEPDGVFGDWNGGPTPFDAAALTLTRKINAVGYKAIRESGGKNGERVIMLATNGQGNHSTIEEVFPAKSSLPGGGTDKYIAIQVHTYDPWSFCGENGSNNSWPGSSTLISAVNKVAAHSTLLGVPINYGEFGVGRASNTAERNTDIVREYYRTMRLAAINKSMSVTMWDDRGWFALVAKNGGGEYDFLYSIVPAMMAP
jgi:aryl-phospho-beta-D-glucosidase BglC (GH1 family)